MTAIAKARLVSVGGACCAFLLIGGATRPPSRLEPERTAVKWRGPDRAERGRLEAAVEAILPAGYRVTRTVTETAPPDWHTDEPKAGFRVEGGNGTDTFRVCFLPRDWIGIRKLPNDAPKTCYWEGIGGGDRYKVITAGNDDVQKRVQHRLGEARMTPCLCNGGFDQVTRIFRGQLAAADRAALGLVRAHCKTPGEFAEAAHSLVVLGVPAKAVFLRAAREVPGLDKDLFCSALGHIGGDDAIGVLCEVAADAKVDDQRRMHAAMALDDHADPRIGPALHKAIREIEDGEAAGVIARVLMHRRYVDAAPDMVAAMKRISDDCGKIRVAKCLAGMRYAKVVPAIRRLADEFRKRPGTPPDAYGLQFVLERLTGTWGTEGEGMRVRLAAPAEVVAGEKVLLTVSVENTGNEGFQSFGTQFGLAINGRFRDEGRCFVASGLSYLVLPGEVHEFSVDLTEDLKRLGLYALKYPLAGGCSNEVTVRVRARDSR